MSLSTHTGALPRWVAAYGRDHRPLEGDALQSVLKASGATLCSLEGELPNDLPNNAVGSGSDSASISAPGRWVVAEERQTQRGVAEPARDASASSRA